MVLSFIQLPSTKLPQRLCNVQNIDYRVQVLWTLALHQSHFLYGHDLPNGMIALDLISTFATATAFRVALFVVSSSMSSLLVVWLQQSHSRALPLLDRLNTACSRVWGKRSTESQSVQSWITYWWNPCSNSLFSKNFISLWYNFTIPHYAMNTKYVWLSGCLNKKTKHSSKWLWRVGLTAKRPKKGPPQRQIHQFSILIYIL